MNKQCGDASGQATVNRFDKKVIKLIFVGLRFDAEKPIKKVFKGKAEGLCWEIPDDINQVSPP
jgi:hypothetical protein